MAILTGVIFDHSTLLSKARTPQIQQGLRTLFANLKAYKIKTAILSTHNFDVRAELKQRHLPDPDLFLTRGDVGVPKGSEVWIEETARRLNINRHETLFVGDGKYEWLSAINSATMYLHANWADKLPAGATAFTIDDPLEIWEFITHFLLLPPRWEYKLDDEESGLHIRCLLAAHIMLESNLGGFELKDVFYHKRQIEVGSSSARDLLMIHAISSLYLEGLIQPKSTYFAVYPSHTPGKRNPVLEEFLIPVAKFFRSNYKEDLIVRAVELLDSSEEKYRAKVEHRQSKASFQTQTNSVHLNPSYRDSLEGKPVVVVDDFTSSGRSLDWARNLLVKAGASPVILFTVGRFGRNPPHTHTLYTPLADNVVTPFELKEYKAPKQFKRDYVQLAQNLELRQTVQKSFKYLKANQPFPL